MDKKWPLHGTQVFIIMGGKWNNKKGRIFQKSTVVSGGGGGTAIPVTDHGGPLGCEMLRLAALHASRSLPAQEDFWYSFLLRDWVDPRVIVQLEGLGQLKNPMTSS
jgi:hypothetical protein